MPFRQQLLIRREDLRNFRFANLPRLAAHADKTFFKATAKDDPTGAAAMKKVTGMTPAELEPVWREWVLGLRYQD